MTRHCIECIKDPTKKPKTATFNFADKPPMYCKTHMDEGMVNTKDPVCTGDAKHGKPSYNFPGEKAKYCQKCKEPGMINVASKMCADCKKKKPSFNVAGKSAKYCFDCAQQYENMVNVNNKKCAHILENGKYCEHAPHFNLPGKKGGIYCSTHKPDGYVDVIHPVCPLQTSLEKCAAPAYNFKGLKPIYCSRHAQPGMVDVKHPLCKLCDYVYIQESNGYENMCVSCYAFTYPNKEIVTNFLVKERFIVNYLKDKYSKYTWTHNKTISSCIKYRPDLLLDLGTHVVIIEIDEHQHNTNLYKECDLKRTMDILAEIARPVIMLRINPDNYVDKKKKHKSMFKKSGKKLVVDNVVWNERRIVIDETFTKCIDVPTELLMHVELFFDC